MSSWYPNYTESDIFHSVVRALEDGGTTLIDVALIQVPWTPGYRVRGRGRAAANDRVVLIVDEYPPEGAAE